MSRATSRRLPDLNGTNGGPGTIGPPQPEGDAGTMRRAIREHLRKFVAIIALTLLALPVTVGILSQQQARTRRGSRSSATSASSSRRSSRARRR